MKVAMTGLGVFTLLILVVSIVMALGKDNRESERLAEVVELVVYQSLQEGIEKKEDPGELFLINLELLLEDEAYNVVIQKSDYEKGILSVEVELFYNNMGKARSIEVERTVVWERIISERWYEMCKIC